MTPPLSLLSPPSPPRPLSGHTANSSLVTRLCAPEGRATASCHLSLFTCHFARRALSLPGFGQSGSSPAKPKFSNDWKLFSNGWKNHSVFSNDWKIFRQFSNDWKNFRAHLRQTKRQTGQRLTTLREENGRKTHAEPLRG